MLKVEGIVIGEMKYQENSKILKIFTKELGKISVMARGACNPKSKMIAIAQPFVYGQFILNKGRNFYYLSSGELIDSNYDLRNKMERLVYASHIVELVDKSSEDEQKNDSVYELLLKALSLLADLEEDYLKFILAFELKFVSFIGYRPNLKSCVSCNDHDLDEFRFSIVNGGIVCKKCGYYDRTSISLSNDQYGDMCKLLYAKLDEVFSIDVEKKDLKYLHDSILRYILYHIDRKTLNSIDFMKILDE